MQQMDRLQLDYFYGAQADSFSFYYFPKLLIQDDSFRNMSLDAKILYGIMLASNSASIVNGWLDQHGFVYIKYSGNTICEKLGCCRNKAISLIKELLDLNLLEKKKTEKGKATEYYLKQFFVSDETPEKKSVIYSRFRTTDSYAYSFFRLPQILFTDKCFSSLSSEAKLLYSILLDRMSLSRAKNWIDEQNRAYVEFDLKEMTVLLRRSRNTVYNLLNELDRIGLIESKRRGQGRTNLYYIKNFLSQHLDVSTDAHKLHPEAESSESQKMHMLNPKKCTGDAGSESQKMNNLNPKKCTSSGAESGTLESKKSNSIYTKDNTNYQGGKSYPSSKGRNAEKTAKEWMEEYAALEIKIAENIERDALIQQFDSDIVDGSISLIVRELCVQKEFITISGDKIPRALFAERMLMLRKKHVEYALNSVLSVMDTIKSLEPYLLKTLFLAPETYTLSTIQKAAAKQNSLKKAPSKKKKSGFDYQDQREYDYDEIKRRKLLARDKQKGFYYEDQREYDYKELEKTLLLKK